MRRGSGDAGAAARGRARWVALWPVLGLAAAAAAALAVLSPGALLILVCDGLPAAAVVAAACGWGAWPAAWLGLSGRPRLQVISIAATLGAGLVSALTLALGLLGGLAAGSAWGLVIAGWVAGLAALYAGQSRGPASTGAAEEVGPPCGNRTGAAGLLLLTLAGPAAVALFGACLPPGILWFGENQAYDVLEYHLQVPREYYDAGRIHFLPHNVYAAFPQQMEMQYLLLMHLLGGPCAAAVPAQILHALWGVLAVIGLAAWTPAGWARFIVAVTAGSVPWLAYLASLAYVEMGVLLPAGVAGGLVLDAVRRGAPAGWRSALAAGFCAGIAGGAKYTALVFVAGALAAAWLIVGRGRLAGRVRDVGIYGAGVVLAFGPWLAKNALLTGNPVYPFAYRWFGGAAWSPAQDEQWARGHAVPPDRAGLGGRLRTLLDELLAARMFGPAIFVLAALGAVRLRSRATALLLCWLGLLVLAWAALTHMPGRFLVPAVVPLALLGGQAAEPRAGRSGGRGNPLGALALVLAGVGAVGNGITLAGVLRVHVDWWAARGVALGDLAGATEAVARELEPVNRIVPPGRRVRLVGEARAFYIARPVQYTVAFSRDAWLERAREASPAEAVAWLRSAAVDYVVFSWPEIERLSRTYGFPRWVNRAWVAGLVPAGLRPVALPPEVAESGIEVYEVARQ